MCVSHSLYDKVTHSMHQCHCRVDGRMVLQPPAN